MKRSEFVRFLIIGDVYGKPGREYLAEKITELKEKYTPDCLIVNGENAAHGNGLTQVNYKQFMELGFHCVTMGNHLFGHRQIVEFIDDAKIARPANLHATTPGKEYVLINFNGIKIAVINLLGQVTMQNPGGMQSPFEKIDTLLEIEEIKNADYRIVDFHAEATSEKIAFGYHVDGRVDIVYGTHTHVQTADLRQLENGTVYITDIGMTGPLDGVIGVEKDIIIERFLNGLPKKFDVAQGKRQLGGIFVEIDRKRERLTFERVYITE